MRVFQGDFCMTDDTDVQLFRAVSAARAAIHYGRPPAEVCRIMASRFGVSALRVAELVHAAEDGCAAARETLSIRGNQTPGLQADIDEFLEKRRGRPRKVPLE
jgi:hypothetical protein